MSPKGRHWEFVIIYFLAIDELKDVSMTPSDPNGFSEPPVPLIADYFTIRAAQNPRFPNPYPG